ncbi:dihydroneopterin aldolase [Oxalobacter paraformigenes]|uniref:dihydroneopterin aldolase n=1 Tax=Oxalobacter paraformigenes TaxID=556268 RepID=UPI0001A28A84|nr:dihydroneopterin aldolase [Oxalobacter paraformigenes]
MHTLLHPKLKNCRRLFLRNYEVPVKIGVHDFEKKGAQRLLINVDLYIPLTLSTPVNDQLAEVVDYSFIRDTLSERTSKGHINLQETLCDDVARLLLAHPHVFAVRVSSEKPDVYEDCESIGVEVFRFRDND